MARFSFIGDIVETVGKNARTAKEVMETAGKSANRNAAIIKNAVNSVQSNMSSGQAKAVTEMGVSSSRALKEGIDNAVSQVKANTAEKALNRTARQGNAAVQKSREIVENKRVNQIIDGHNAKQRDVEMQTIVNNVKDRMGTRVPKDHDAARRAVHQANETVRNARIINEPDVNPMYVPKSTTYSYQNNANTGGGRRRRRGHSEGLPEEYIDYKKNNPNIDPNEYNGLIERAPWSTTEPVVEPQFGFDTRQQRIDSTVEPKFNTGNNNQQTGNSQNRSRGNQEAGGGAGSGFKDQAADFFFGGIKDSYNNVTTGEQDLFTAIANAHKNDDGSMNWKRAAGTFVTASAAARVVSGGGLYKDRYGNPNLIGVPFI